MGSEMENLLREELRLIRSSQEALESGLNRVYAHLIHSDKTRSETEVVLSEIASHVANMHKVLLKHIEDEDSRLSKLEHAIKAHISGGGNGKVEIEE